MANDTKTPPPPTTQKPSAPATAKPPAPPLPAGIIPVNNPQPLNRGSTQGDLDYKKT